MRNRLLIAVLVSLLTTLSAWAGSVWSIDEDQTWYSDGCIVTYDAATKTMTVSPRDAEGFTRGVMHDYDEHDPGMTNFNQKRPWHDVKHADEDDDNDDDTHSYQKIEHVVVESGVTHIGNRAFNSFYGLKTLSILEGVTSIGVAALQWFIDEDFTEITIPSTVTSIEGGNFVHCWYVTDLTMLPNPEHLAWRDNGLDEFEGYEDGYKTVRCHVPAEYLDEYIQNWAMGEELVDYDTIEYRPGKFYYYQYYITTNINVSFAPIATELSNPWASITPWEGQYTDFFLNRTLYKDGYFNTLCLPFNLSASEIAASPIAGGELFTYESAEVVGEAQLDIHISPATAITAGVPYLIRWNSGEDINGSTTRIKFEHVLIPEGVAAQTITSGDVQFIGFFEPTHIDDENEDPNHNSLFLGAENTLYWPINDGTSIKGFRAYFKVNTGSGASNAPRRGMSAGLSINAPQITTDVESLQPSDFSIQKIIRDGQVFIIRDDKIYNTLGVEIK